MSTEEGAGLRVLMVTHYWRPHVGGVETVARDQAAGLAMAGADVEVHTSWLPRVGPRRSVEADPAEAGVVRVVRHPASDVLMRWLQLPVPIPWPGTSRLVARAAREADVVLAHGHAFPSSSLAAAAARRARVPFVLVQHAPWVEYGPVLNAVQRLVDRTLGRRVITSASVVVCVSEHTAGHVRSIVPSAAVRVVPNGVDARRFRPSDDGAVSGTGPSSRPVLLFVGRLVRRNGWSVLLDAWRDAGLADRAELHIVGDGPDAPDLRDAVVGREGVVLLGAVPDDELPERYRRAHAVIVPTLAGVGFGLTAAEAIACGTPVVASARGGHREVVRDGVDGLLVDPDAPGALATALVRMVDEAGLRDRLALGARAVDRSSDTSVAALLGILAGTVRGVRGARGWV